MKRAWILIVVALLASAKFGYDYFYFDTNARDQYVEKLTPQKQPVAPLIRVVEFPQSSPPVPSDLDVQESLNLIGVPTGVIDGKWGQRTRQGLCIWRELTGRQVDRNFPIDIERYAITNAANYLGKYGEKYSPFDLTKLDKKYVVGLNINKTCQSALWIKDNSRKNFLVTIASTGAPGLDSDSGTFKIGWSANRWYESIAYPDGWMYRPLFYNRGQAIHGSEYDSYVWWYPASHGCVRMLGKDIDALWAAGFGVGGKVHVYGAWNPLTQDPV